MTPRLSDRLRAFLRDETGSIAVEGMIVLPILTWAYVGSFVFFDGYRAQSVNVKAAYTIGDVLSRETGFITPEYMDSLYALQDQLTETEQPRRMRITALRYEETGDKYLVCWSKGRGGVSELSTGGLGALRDRLPVMADGEWGMLTETWVGYVPVFEAGIDPFTFEDFVVTRLRFAPQLFWNTVNENPTMATAQSAC